MSFGMVSASYLGVINTPTPVLAVAFDEGSGNTFSPTIGPGTGTVTPGYGQWIPGPNSGTSLGRHNTDPGDYDDNPCALLTGLSSLNTASWSGMTVMAWVNLHPMNTSPRWPLLLMNDDDGWMGWEVPYNSEGMVSWVNGTSMFTPDAAPESIWIHLCVTWDGTMQRVYKDGALMASGAVAGPLSNTTDIAIGSARFNYGAQGVDDLRIYDQALTEAQLITLIGIAV